MSNLFRRSSLFLLILALVMVVPIFALPGVSCAQDTTVRDVLIDHDHDPSTPMIRGQLICVTGSSEERAQEPVFAFDGSGGGVPIACQVPANPYGFAGPSLKLPWIEDLHGNSVPGYTIPSGNGLWVQFDSGYSPPGTSAPARLNNGEVTVEFTVHNTDPVYCTVP